LREAPITATDAGSSSGRSDATVAPASRCSADLEARLAEDVEHRRILRERQRFEAADAVRRSQHRQPLQQHGAETLALKLVVDRECDLGARRIALEVRANRNRPQLAVDFAKGEQRC
jgi:hypothetical protein